MTDCDSITDCITCITSVMHCFFILTGIGDSASWSCVSSVAGLSGVRMTVTQETREFCPSLPNQITSNEIVTYLSFALVTFCIIGICIMSFWARSHRPRTTSPPPPQPLQQLPPPVPPHHPALRALASISTFAQRRQEERERSLNAFNRRNAEFQRELAERLEAVRARRDAAYPPTPRNTPEPVQRFIAVPSLPQISRHQSPAPGSRQPSPAPSIPSRSFTPAPPNPQSVSHASTPIMHQSREPTPFSREVSAGPPEINVSPIHPQDRSEHEYDTPADTIYESIENSPDNSPPPNPPSPEPRSRFGRLLRRPSFFKCKW